MHSAFAGAGREGPTQTSSQSSPQGTMRDSIKITNLAPSQGFIPDFSRVLICPSGFKESLGPDAVCNCIEAGVLRAMPNARITKLPMVDGGQGFAEGLVAATKGQLVNVKVTGPVRLPVDSHFGFLGTALGYAQKTAVMEMAAAAGLHLVPRDLRQPLMTTTYGVGELIKSALDAGAEHILFGCGDSGTCDGGVGMAQALGAKFYATDGTEIPLASGAIPLETLASADLSGLDPRLSTVKIDVACNWHNLLCGPRGVARVFGPQKGASPADVEKLEHAMNNVAAVVKANTGIDASTANGSGASGGLGAGLQLIGATLHSRFDIITKFLKLDEFIANCDIAFTAEGGIDNQTPYGKIPSEVARRAKRFDVPVVALAGTIGDGANVNYGAGIRAYASICQRPTTLEDAIAGAERLLIDAAEGMMRTIMVGYTMNRSPSPGRSPNGGGFRKPASPPGFQMRRTSTAIY
ncbi:hypothetical protein LTR37_003264 [Vermiconidia calcicola]|uniref:Uncharacterized protein n=1 Tax=Vermiconidia calcicola TaxID=1690605 RepID=A0ACC3NQY7_9PEZI|nr:hypothetical protein LTR37_003264 [Vermiconidia calcicola]